MSITIESTLFSEDFEINFEVGSLLDFIGDAIVVNTNVRLNLNYTSGKAVLGKSGRVLDQELKHILMDRYSGKDLPLGTAVSTIAFGMSDQVRNLIFVSWWNHDNEYSG
jgi:hypothetical protein